VAELAVLHRGKSSARTRALAAATNRRLQARDLGALQIPEQEQLTGEMLLGIRKAAWALGAALSTLQEMDRTGAVPIGVQRLILNPGRRNEAQQKRGRARMSRMRAERKRRAKAREVEGARGRAVSSFLAYVGTTESPPGSNGGPHISAWQAEFGFGRVAWCGIACAHHLRAAGVPGVTSRLASVALIEQDARAGRAPFVRWSHDARGALPGDLVVIGGHGVHVEMVRRVNADGSVETIGGNTSFGAGGSQSNGGCVAARHRSASEITGVAHVDFPN
jgi:hypothetical protein